MSSWEELVPRDHQSLGFPRAAGRKFDNFRSNLSSYYAVDAGLQRLANRFHWKEINLIRLGIVDDHPVFRLGLRRSFERLRDLKVMWDLGSATNLLETIRTAPVDVVLMDLDLGPNQDGFTAIRSLQEAKPKPRVVVITASIDAVSVTASKRAGASGYLAKDLPVADLVAAVRQLAAPGAKLAVFGHELTNGNGRAWSGVRGLTKREQEVLGELNRGRTNREIAMSLGVSVTTVNKHVQQVLKKLHVRNRGQAVARMHAEL